MAKGKFIVIAILLAAAAVAAFMVLMPGKAPAAHEVVMSGDEFAQEYNRYKVDPPELPAGKEYYDFPSLAPGDILHVRGSISGMGYSNRTHATDIVLSGFERCQALRDGLFFAGNLTGKFALNDMVEITFHVIHTEGRDQNGTLLYSAELLDELNGKARDRSPDGIPASAIRKFQ